LLANAVAQSFCRFVTDCKHAVIINPQGMDFVDKQASFDAVNIAVFTVWKNEAAECLNHFTHRASASLALERHGFLHDVDAILLSRLRNNSVMDVNVSDVVPNYGHGRHDNVPSD
jgi:hypothetical protein